MSFALSIFENVSPSFILVYSKNKPGQAISITPVWKEILCDHVNTDMDFLLHGVGVGWCKELKDSGDRGSTALFLKRQNTTQLAAGC